MAAGAYKGRRGEKQLTVPAGKGAAEIFQLYQKTPAAPARPARG